MKPREPRDGDDGLSAYEIARRHGFRGTEPEWIGSLRKGPTGPPGGVGPRGPSGEKGERGLRGLDGCPGLIGKAGASGSDGWTPVLAVVEDGERRVHRVVGWTGGSGEAPESGWYVARSGPVDRASEATDIRGPRGLSGFSGTVSSGSTALGVPTYILDAFSDPTPDAPAVVYRPTGAPDTYTMELYA